MSQRVLVIGGGISGLAAAWYLLRDGEGLEVSLVETASRCGGTMGTESADGFLMERGPNGFLDGKGELTLELAREMGLGSELIAASETSKKRFILKGGRLLSVPMGPGILLSSLLSLKGRIRLMTEPWRARCPEGQEDSVATFVRRRLGQEVLDYLLDPIVTGVYAGDVERLSMSSAFGRLVELETQYGSLIKALWALRKKRRATGAGASSEAGGSGKAAGPGGPGGSLRSFRRGLGSLVDALVDRLGDRVRVQQSVEAVQPIDGGRLEVVFRDAEPEVYDSVVVACPAPRAATFFSTSRPELSQALERIPYAAVGVVCLGLDREMVGHPLDGYGFLIPRLERVRTLGMIWTSSLFPDHAPEGQVNLRAMVGGARDPEVVGKSADELVELVLSELREILDLRGDPRVTRVYRYMQGIPQYNLGHSRRLADIEKQRWQLPGLYLTGNAYDGVGINDCIQSSLRLSTDVLRKLREH